MVFSGTSKRYRFVPRPHRAACHPRQHFLRTSSGLNWWSVFVITFAVVARLTSDQLRDDHAVYEVVQVHRIASIVGEHWAFSRIFRAQVVKLQPLRQEWNIIATRESPIHAASSSSPAAASDFRSSESESGLPGERKTTGMFQRCRICSSMSCRSAPSSVEHSTTESAGRVNRCRIAAAVLWVHETS